MQTLPNFSELTPAYGRNFKTKAEAVASWEAGQDWMYASTGQYTSMRDQAPGTTVMLRYKSLRAVTTYKLA
jgi:hypothetical protein